MPLSHAERQKAYKARRRLQLRVEDPLDQPASGELPEPQGKDLEQLQTEYLARLERFRAMVRALQKQLKLRLDPDEYQQALAEVVFAADAIHPPFAHGLLGLSPEPAAPTQPGADV